MRRPGATPACAVAAALASALAGCESTQDKAARLHKGSSTAFERGGVRVLEPNPDVKVLLTEVVAGDGSAAVVVRMRNASAHTLARLPVAIDVRDGARKSVFRNDAPGLERSLAELALLRPGEELSWVNDQVPAQGRPRQATARIGVAGRTPGRAPRMRIQGARLGRDGDAATAIGFVRNDSGVEQRELIVYAVARRSGRVVAAGRAQIQRLAPRARGAFTVFFAGDPRGARLEISAPPTVLKGRVR